MAKKQLFLVDHIPGPDWVTGVDTREQQRWDEHAAFIDGLFDTGYIGLGGPLQNGDGAAVMVMDAESEEQIRALLAPDPWCVERDMLRVGEIRRWRIFLDARRSD